MKKIIFLLLSLITLSYGEPMDRTGPYIALGGGYAVFYDDQRMDAEPLGVNHSYNINIIGGAFINRYLSVEIAYDYYETFENDKNSNTTKLSVADVAVKAHYPFWKERIDLYGAFGAGQIYWDENLNGISQDDQSGVLRADVGVGFRALKWLTINVGYRRYIFTLDHETGERDIDNNIIYQQYNMELGSAYTNIEVLF